MRLTGSTYRFYVKGSDAATGPLGARDGVLYFSASNTCGGTGSYRWRLRGDVLRLTAAGPDGCPRGTFVAAAPWRRR
jgi:hypothetical protein